MNILIDNQKPEINLLKCVLHRISENITPN